MEISGFIWAEIQVFNRLPKVINNCQKKGSYFFYIFMREIIFANT